MKLQDVKCATCGRAFHPKHSGQAYCSVECFRSAQRSEPEWTPEEVQTLVENYPKMGKGVVTLFPKRSRVSVIRMANVLGLRVDRKGRYINEKIAFLDIETSGRAPDFTDVVLSWALKVRNGKLYYDVIRKHELFDINKLDKRLISHLIDVIKKEKITKVVAYYGGDNRFDIPFLRTRALRWGLDFLMHDEVEFVDPYTTVKKKFMMTRRRLEDFCRLAGIDGKNHVDAEIWTMARVGDRKALKYVLDHNIRDVQILEMAYERLAPYIANSHRSA